MQRLYVVAFPEIGARDAAWVESLRAAHDRAGHDMLKAHFTFVFGCTGVSIDVVEHAVRAVARDMRPIEFCLARAVSVTHCGFHYVYLCPDKGAPDVIKLHTKLHAGSLAGCLDPHQPFTPHLTVCKTADPNKAGQVLSQLQRNAFRVPGTLPALVVGAVLDGKFERQREIPCSRLGT